MLSNSPGALGFELAPFKFPVEYVELLGGIDSPHFKKMKQLMCQSFVAIRKHAEKIILLTEMMAQSTTLFSHSLISSRMNDAIDSKLACFAANPTASINALRERFMLHATEKQLEETVDLLIMQSCGSHFTKLYDIFQYYSQGVM